MNQPRHGFGRRALSWPLTLLVYVLFSMVLAAPAEGATATYYWQEDSGTSVAGFTTDVAKCNDQERDILVTTLMTTGGFNCDKFRHEGTAAVPQNLWLMIKDTVYAIATDVTGIDFALDFLDDSSSGGVTARYELGYAQAGVFTSWGFVDEGPHEPEALYVTDLSSISGTAPAGSHLALRILDVAPSDGVMRMFTGSDTGSGILNVDETAAGPPVCPSGGTVSTTVDSTTGDSLRACIIWANGNPGVDTLTVPAGTYTLTIAGTGEDAAATGDLDITDGIIINGNAAGATIIDANSIDRVFEIFGASATFTNLTVTGGNVTGSGAGISIDPTGSLTLSNSTVSGNTTTADGGGIHTSGTAANLTNVTLSGNTANRGGGLDCAGTCTLTNVTVTANTAATAGDGVRHTGGSTTTFLNTIVANNLSGGVTECSGSAAQLASSGNNLSSDASCDFTAGGDQQNTDPLLGPLQDNGGPTFTHDLLVGSTAIEGGTNTGCPATDQRGTARPESVLCDIGAVEGLAPSGPAVCQVDPTGTYIEAENFTGTIVQGTAFFTEETAQGGHNGSGYLLSNGGGAGATPVHEGKIYNIEFPAPGGGYNVRMRGYAAAGADSLFIGLGGSSVGALNENGTYGIWVWTNNIQLGGNQITAVAGFNDFNAWIRENNHLVDGFYLTQGGETPTGGIPPGVPTLDPVACQSTYADLAVTKGVDDPTPVEGSTITYTVTVTNNGPATATVIQIADALPLGVTYVSDTPTQGSYDSISGDWIVGSLANSASATLTIQATVDAGTAGSTITNTASVSFLSQSDPNASNDSDSVDIDPINILEIVKRSFQTDSTPIASGSIVPSYLEFKYLLYINNNGGARTDVSVRDILDPAFQYQLESMRVDNSVAACALAVCDAAEELAIFTAVNGAAVLTDAVGDDVVSYAAATIDAGNENAGNLQLDINADSVWAILFSVKMP